MPGLGLLNPLLAVAGIALVAIPVVIHILNRRRFKRVSWAAMDFLLRAMKKNRKRLRFESWLLLLTRCAVLALLGLAMARPLGCQDSAIARLAGRPSGLHVIVLDTSGSMSYQRPDDATNLDIARQVAVSVVQRLDNGGERVAVVTAGQPAALLYGEATYDIAAVTGALDEVSPGYGGTDLAGALELAGQLADAAGDEPTRVLHLVTDAATGAWTDPATAARLVEIGPALGESFTNIVHHNVAVANPANAAVTPGGGRRIGPRAGGGVGDEVQHARRLVPGGVGDLRAADGIVRSGFNNAVDVTIRGYGNVGRIDAAATMDGQPITFEGNGLEATPSSAPIRFSPALNDGGRHLLNVRLGRADELPADDERRTVLDVAAALPVLIVEGRRGMDPLSGSGVFIDTALAPPADNARPGVTTNSYVRTELISDLELGGKVLGNYRAVVLADVGGLDDDAAHALQKYVENGGTLMLFLGDQVTVDGYNATLGSRGLLPGEFVEEVRTDGGARFDFDPNDPLHPYLSAFQGVQRTGLDNAEVFRHVRIAADPARAETVLALRNETADPIILTHRLGAGTVVTMATSASVTGEWNTLAIKKVFVALLHELLSHAAGGGDRWMNVDVGAPLTLPATVRVTATPTLRRTQGTAVDLQRGATGQWQSPPLTEPGVLTLDVGGVTYPIAVNMPASESDVRRLDDAALREALGGIDMTFSDVNDTVGVVAQDGNDFGWPLLLGVLVLAAAETFMALRFGHSKT